MAVTPVAEPAVRSAAPLAAKCGLDRVGMWVSFACAVHCAALPLLLTVAGMGWLGNEYLEWGIILTSFVIASFRLTYSYLKVHRRGDSMILFFVGACSILTAKATIFDFTHSEPVFMTIGGLLIASAHWRNHYLTHAAGVPHAH